MLFLLGCYLCLALFEVFSSSVLINKKYIYYYYSLKKFS